MDTFLVKAFASTADTSKSAQENLMKRYEACNFSDNEEDFVSAPPCSGCPWCYRCSHTWVSKSEVYY